MNTRVLELIKNPKIITETDLNILESEAERMPYAQSVRALYLYGINLYKTENYKENLSKTAAYTTDKKILYQFINSQKINKKDEVLVQKILDEASQNQVLNETVTAEDLIEKNSESPADAENASVVLNKFDIDKIIENESSQNSEFIVVAGEKNRLLYEGEENFLEEKSEEIDMEATKESGIITIKDELESKENLIINDDNRSEETIAEHTNVEEVLDAPETKIAESVADTQVQDEDSSGNISFNGIEDFLPQVKFSVPKNHLEYLNPPKREARKQETQSIEKPVSTSEYQEPVVEDISEDKIDSSQISFEETQTFEVSKSPEIEKTEGQNVNQIAEQEAENEISFENPQAFEVTEPENIKDANKTDAEPVSTWKPMSFSANTPDALIGKAAVVETPQQEINVEENIDKSAQSGEIIIKEKQAEEVKPQISESERPVMNVSFFGNDVVKIEEKEKEKEIPAILDKVIEHDLADSNVGSFINTWQNWLKIDRPKDAETAEKTIVVKEKIIDQFIEKNPRISQLKDEVNFIVKEKKDDISHLMTETLAKLYVEQKLYSKAIKAYETLIEKHPQRKDYFNEKIEEVKEIRKS